MPSATAYCIAPVGGDTDRWVCVVSVWEQRKIEVRKMLENASESHTSGAPEKSRGSFFSAVLAPFSGNEKRLSLIILNFILCNLSHFCTRSVENYRVHG